MQADAAKQIFGTMLLTRQIIKQQRTAMRQMATKTADVEEYEDSRSKRTTGSGRASPPKILHPESGSRLDNEFNF